MIASELPKFQTISSLKDCHYEVFLYVMLPLVGVMFKVDFLIMANAFPQNGGK